MTEQTSPSNLLSARVLIVDDHPNTALTLSRAISQLGPSIEVISATNGKTALERVRDGAVDLLITDMMMPEMNGLELIEKLKSHPGGRPTYTILITAYDVPGLRESARRLKVDETIIKPVRPERVCQIVSQALGNMSKVEQSASETKPQQTFKILIADDIPDNIALLSRYLQSEGYSYITASDGVETLEKTRTELPDLILLDINMPKMDGFEVLQEIRVDPAIEHIPVIILTAARIGHADMQAGFNLGADDYVTKPFDRRELLARIRTKLRVKAAEDVIRQRNKELSVLPEIGRELSAILDINELADVVLRRAVEALGAMVGHVVILNRKNPLHKEYHLDTTDASNFDFQLPPLNEFLETIRDTHQGLILEDTTKDPRWQALPDDPTRSVIMIPMFGRLDLIGLLILAHEQTAYFNLEHQLLFQAIASQAAIAVENAQLYEVLLHEQQRSTAVLEGAADAILMFDADGCLSLLNPAAEKLFTDYEAKLGLPLARGCGYDALIELLEETYTSGESKTEEITWPDQRVFIALFTPIEEGGCVVLLHDVSHFKALERVKNEFISTASHDLKNPITTISGFSQLIPKIGPLDPKQLDFVERIQSAAEHMQELVQNLLDLAKIDMGVESEPETIDMNALLVEITDEFQPQAEAKGQALHLEKANEQPKVQGDALQLRQALRNLVGNAIKYTPDAGSVDLSIKTDDALATICVKDTGYGIPPDDLPFIFDRFYRVRDEAVKDIEGNGLGLAIVKSIIEKHGGQISVESEPGKGSCFTFYLPLVPIESQTSSIPETIPG
jgi:two-component system, OmpR family, phosphate regulon sensor histidine kinase PhoR